MAAIGAIVNHSGSIEAVAAGLGRIDLMRGFFDGAGSPEPRSLEPRALEMYRPVVFGLRG